MDYKGIETKCIHSGYCPENSEPHVAPIAQSTTYRYTQNCDVADLFDLKSDNHMYSRISNPTVAVLENKMAALEGGVAAVAASSGQSATLMTVLNICEQGDNIITARNIYGGTSNLFGVSLKKLGIDVRFFNQDDSEQDIEKLVDGKTKAIFGETLGNAALSVLDFEKFSNVAKKVGIPFIVDNTLATPYLCRPIEHGANIVVHSTTKYSDGHATSLGGMVVDGGNFDWMSSDRFSGLTKPEPSYHGLVYAEAFKQAAFAVKLRSQMLRDFGAVMSPMNAFLTNLGLETLHLRMERHCENALVLAKYLSSHDKVEWVNYPGLDDNRYHELQQKYMPKGASGVLCFGAKGGRKSGETVIENLELTSLAVHVGDLRTMVLHPASATHRQLSEQDQIACGIRPELLRVSVGIENIDDIKADFENALSKI